MIRVRTKLDPGAVMDPARKATFKNLGHAAAALRLTARRSLKASSRPSAPGTPPHTRGNKRLKNAIKYAVDKAKQAAIIGPDAEIAGNVAKAHEFGGRFRNEFYDKRPFMGPALDKINPRLPSFWAGSLRR